MSKIPVGRIEQSNAMVPPDMPARECHKLFELNFARNAFAKVFSPQMFFGQFHLIFQTT